MPVPKQVGLTWASAGSISGEAAVLYTKLQFPPVRGNLVRRPRLVEKLNAAACLVSTRLGEQQLLIDRVGASGLVLADRLCQNC